MADNETTADVIAWLRRPIEGENAYLTLWRDEIADRLEAAHRRERGNAAKLREALENLYDQICYGETEQHVAANRQMIRAALAAPPRNCDLLKVVEDPWRAWLDDESNWEDGYPKLEIHDWLLAPATEKEGDNDGNE